MYTHEARVTVFPFTRQPEGEGEVVIGRAETGAFLSLPPDAVEILDILSTGETVGRAQEMYHKKYGETPEMTEFLTFLETKGFVKPAMAAGWPVALDSEADQTVPRQRRHHFTSIPRPVAQALFSKPALAMVAVLLALATVAVSEAPEIFPGRSALYFHHDRTLMALCLVLLGYATVFLHEMGHLVAARARNVNSRLGISRRMWMLVAETDLTGLWAVPKAQRYLPLLAGPVVDLASAAAMLLVVYAFRQHWISLPIPVVELLRAMCFVYLMRLLWQCFFFVRTDFYYVIANFFGCKSLMQDTQAYLQNQFRRLLFRLPPVADQAGLPERERRVVRTYAWVWLLGRGAALITLFSITIPVTLRYLKTSSHAIVAGFSEGPYAFLDGLFILVFILLPIVIGLSWWIGSFVKRWRLPHDKRAYSA